MVKGINRTVIEINDTGSGMFEKVILFVTPQYGNIGTKRLKDEAERVIEQYMSDSFARPTVRQRHRKQKITAFWLAIGAIAAVAVTAVLLIF